MKLQVGFFLATRQLRRGSVWTSLLIIFIMMLTFLNLVVVSGILIGLPTSASDSYRQYYSGDVFVVPKTEKEYILSSEYILQTLEQLPYVTHVSPRFVARARVQSDYKTKTRKDDAFDEVNAQIVGINPLLESSVTEIDKFIIDGEFLTKQDHDQIVIASDFLDQYTLGGVVADISGGTLEDVKVGDKVRVVIGEDVKKEYTLKGVMKSKVGILRERMFVIDSEFKKLIGRDDNNVHEIAVKISGITVPEAVENMKSLGFTQYATIESWEESLGEFFRDIISTFGLLGNIVGSIGLLVASITVFIVVFINAITRKKYIGILKGVGIDGRAIVYSYVIQAIFYAAIGTILGLLILFGIIKPYIDANPINFPFSDGILFVSQSGILIRVLLLMLATIIAGYLPAKLVVRSNTLNAILGR